MIVKNSMKRHYIKNKNFTVADFVHAKRVRKDFEILNFGEYHDYVQSNRLLLADVFESFRNFEICVMKIMSLIQQNFF